MNDWLTALTQGLTTESSLVRVVVAATRGSAPREAGAAMLVGRDTVEGTIGGGHLEWKAIEIARRLLAEPERPPTRLDRFALGATLGQCCGGAVELWFERHEASERDFLADASRRHDAGQAAWLLSATGSERRSLLTAQEAVERFPKLADIEARALLLTLPSGERVLAERIAQAAQPLWLFGAGHVGKALVRTLAELPFAVTWLDAREDIFPPTLPANATVCGSDDPAGEVAAAPADCMFLVLTHSHDLDYDICRAILRRDDFRFAGLIGSRTKAARFVQRLRRQGVDEGRIARLVCPIGTAGIASKLPAAIAVAVAAQLLVACEARQAASGASSQRHGATR